MKKKIQIFKSSLLLAQQPQQEYQTAAFINIFINSPFSTCHNSHILPARKSTKMWQYNILLNISSQRISFRPQLPPIGRFVASAN